MSHSLNEIDALCRKATRGAGYGWGHAEEAGKTVRWLQARGLPGARLLLACLSDPHPDQAVAFENGRFGAKDDLCPLIAGACLCDRGAVASGFAALHLPLLLVPHAAAAARHARRALCLRWSGVAVTVGPRFVSYWPSLLMLR